MDEKQIERLKSLSDLRASGALTDAEYDQQKAALLNEPSMAAGGTASPQREDVAEAPSRPWWSTGRNRSPKSAAIDGGGSALLFFIFFPLIPLFLVYRRQLSLRNGVVVALLLLPVYGLAAAYYFGALGGGDRISQSELEASVKYKIDAPTDVSCAKQDDAGANWSCLVDFQGSAEPTETVEVTVNEDGSWVSR